MEKYNEGLSRDRMGSAGSEAATSSAGSFDSLLDSGMEVEEATLLELFPEFNTMAFEELESLAASGTDFDAFPDDLTATVFATGDSEYSGVVLEASAPVRKPRALKPKPKKRRRGASSKKRKKTAKSSKRRGRPRKVTAAEISKIAKKVAKKKEQNPVKKQNVFDEEGPGDKEQRLKNNKSAQRSRAKKKKLDSLHKDSWDDLFASNSMTPEQDSVLMDIRAKVGVLMLQVWDLAAEQVGMEFEDGNLWALEVERAVGGGPKCYK